MISSQKTFEDKLGGNIDINRGSRAPVSPYQLREFDADGVEGGWVLLDFVGELMCLSIQSCPDVANATSELARFCDAPGFCNGRQLCAIQSMFKRRPTTNNNSDGAVTYTRSPGEPIKCFGVSGEHLLIHITSDGS